MLASMAGLPVHQLLLLLVAIVPLVCMFRSARRRAGLRLPPGPWALPLIGHLHHLAGALPHRRLQELSQRHGSLMLLRFGELPVVVASSVAAAREIMRTHDLAFATRPIGPATRAMLVEGSEGLIFAPHGDGWRQLRKVCTLELLTARRVQSFRAVREHEVARLLRAVQAAAAAAAAVNLSRRISEYVADSTVSAIMGSRFEDREAFLNLLERGFELFASPSLPDLYPSSAWLTMLLSPTPRRMKRQREKMLAFLETVIQEHQLRQGGDGDEEDLVDVLLRLQRDGDLSISMDNIKHVIADLFSAGSDTSATTLQWAMAELVRNPRVMEKAQAEVRRVLHGHERVTEESLGGLHYLRLVLKETLRLHPPAPLLLPRECRSPCQVLGFDVPAGTTVYVNAWAIGRDPTHWDAPEEFTPERFQGSSIDFKGTDFEFIPFGAGRRMCPGMTFGLANMELALASLLYHFDWELPDGAAAAAAEDLDMSEAMGITVHRRDDLFLVPVVRVPVSSGTETRRG